MPKREMDALRPKGYAGTTDHPGGCPGKNILEIKNSARRPLLVGIGEEEDITYIYIIYIYINIIYIYIYIYIYIHIHMYV